ncbi:hypothetical protein F2Q68_00015026 [Brassica cretica]|uniref:Uncharacterized protein n=2 Tax=Brassica cretica TaxID=69181 RepID=A0A3N6RQ16_BRACR|nr:hypothetical protein F2Q68_00015026 [Brassica cretica]KAF3589324.1 hypothetical protein F2Q69_00028710 [Brassica cretica]KAF3609498.1 hypothetical protein DY000_02047767 [Brassica cretica]
MEPTGFRNDFGLILAKFGSVRPWRRSWRTDSGSSTAVTVAAAAMGGHHVGHHGGYGYHHGGKYEREVFGGGKSEPCLNVRF